MTLRFKNNEDRFRKSTNIILTSEKYIKSKKAELSSEDYQTLMKQNKKDFTTINKAVYGMERSIIFRKIQRRIRTIQRKNLRTK